jgi:hypothetical protein
MFGRRQERVLAALAATQSHSTARVYFDMKPRREGREAPIPLPSAGHGAIDFAAHRVAFDGDSGALYLDGGRWCLPKTGTTSELECHGAVDDPVPPLTPMWMLHIVRGVSRVSRGRHRKAGSEAWTMHHCICDWQRADEQAPVRLAMPHSFRGVWKTPASIWIDETGLIRRLWARQIGFEVDLTLSDFDAPPRIGPQPHTGAGRS